MSETRIRDPKRLRSASCASYCSLGMRRKEHRAGCPVFLSKLIVIGTIRDLLTKWRINPSCGKIAIGGMRHDGTPKQTNGNDFRRY